MTTGQLILILALFAILEFGIIMLAISQGFRMGRQSIDKPLAPVVKTSKAAPVTAEDPFWKPMTGTDQPSYPTVDEK